MSNRHLDVTTEQQEEHEHADRVEEHRALASQQISATRPVGEPESECNRNVDVDAPDRERPQCALEERRP